MATTSRPELVQGQDYLQIGRVTLPRLPQVRRLMACLCWVLEETRNKKSM